jgi:hypothetical protein
MITIPVGEVQIGNRVMPRMGHGDDCPDKVIEIVRYEGATGPCVKLFFAPGDYYVFNLKERVGIER